MKKLLFLSTLITTLLIIISGCSLPKESFGQKTETEPFDSKIIKENGPTVGVIKTDAFDNVPIINLKDVTNGNSSGEAWVSYIEDKTWHKVIAKDLPELEPGYFYEGWMVKQNPLDFFSTGKLKYVKNDETWQLNYNTEGDKTDYNFVVITLEPDDGDQSPAAHILEGK